MDTASSLQPGTWSSASRSSSESLYVPSQTHITTVSARSGLLSSARQHQVSSRLKANVSRCPLANQPILKVTRPSESAEGKPSAIRKWWIYLADDREIVKHSRRIVEAPLRRFRDFRETFATPAGRSRGRNDLRVAPGLQLAPVSRNG